MYRPVNNSRCIKITMHHFTPNSVSDVHRGSDIRSGSDVHHGSDEHSVSGVHIVSYLHAVSDVRRTHCSEIVAQDEAMES